MQWKTSQLNPGKSKDIVLELKEIPFKVHDYKDCPKDGVATDS